MVDPERNPLSGLVEIDEASLPFRTKDDPPTGGQGRSHDGKMLIVGAIELGDGNIPGRLRLAEISSYGAADLGHFVETAADPDAIAKTDGWSGYAAVPADRHNVHVVGKTAAHLVLPWIHQVFSNLKGWARGVYHGLRRKHLQAYLDEFVFRFNRRQNPPRCFPLALPPRHQCRTPYLQHVDRTGAMCISGFREFYGRAENATDLIRTMYEHARVVEMHIEQVSPEEAYMAVRFEAPRLFNKMFEERLLDKRQKEEEF